MNIYKWSIIIGVTFVLGYGIARNTAPLSYIPDVSADEYVDTPVQGPVPRDYLMLPEGCKRLFMDEGVYSKWSKRRVNKSIFVSCHVGQHAYLTVISPQGVKIGEPVKVTD